MVRNGKKEPNVGIIESLVIVIIILAILGYLIIFKSQSPQVPLLISVIMLMIYGKCRGNSWSNIVAGIEKGIKPGIIPLVIFLLIGVLIATWIFSGTIPTIMYFGFKIVSIKFFLPTVFIVCSAVGLVCGSSFTTISTMGIAFMGIGATLHLNAGLTAGAIVSGAFFGANMSPLSGTTNLAAGVGEVELYQHLRSLIYTDIPAWIFSLLIFLIMGIGRSNANLYNIHVIMTQLKNGFWISWWTILPIILLIIFAWIQVPAVPSLSFGSLLAVIIGYFHNPVSIVTVLNYISNGYVAHVGNKSMDNLLSKGGIDSMLSSLSLIIFALALGGLLIEFRIIESLISEMRKFVKTTGFLILVTSLTCVGINFLVGEQYLSIILPGESFKNSFSELKLPQTYLTRVLNDAGASINAVVPWSVSGVFISSTLQLSPFKYIPYSFFPIIVTIATIVIGFILGRGKNVQAVKAQ